MPREPEALLRSIELHTNRVIMSPNYQMALVKKKPRSLPRGRNAKQGQTVISSEGPMSRATTLRKNIRSEVRRSRRLEIEECHQCHKYTVGALS